MIGHLVNAGTIAAVVVIGVVLFALLILSLLPANGADTPPRKLPGSLGDSVQREDAHYERFRDPGMGDLSRGHRTEP